ANPGRPPRKVVPEPEWGERARIQHERIHLEPWYVSPNFRDARGEHGAPRYKRFGVAFSAGPGNICCRDKRQQEEPPVGLEAGSQLKSQGKWFGVGGTFLWDFTYLCWANPSGR